MENDKIIELNELNLISIIKCPYCSKGRMYAYAEVGLISSSCSNCNRIVLWDIKNKTAYKARAKQMKN